MGKQAPLVVHLILIVVATCVLSMGWSKPHWDVADFVIFIGLSLCVLMEGAIVAARIK